MNYNSLDTNYEYRARFGMTFSNLFNTSEVLVVINKNIRVSAAGASFMNTYSPLIKYSANAR